MNEPDKTETAQLDETSLDEVQGGGLWKTTNFLTTDPDGPAPTGGHQPFDWLVHLDRQIVSP